MGMHGRMVCFAKVVIRSSDVRWTKEKTNAPEILLGHWIKERGTLEGVSHQIWRVRETKKCSDLTGLDGNSHISLNIYWSILFGIDFPIRDS